MIVDEFRYSLEFFKELIEKREIDASLLASMDRRLCDISNHIAVCHRVVAEKRSEAKTIIAIFSLRESKLLQEAERAGETLNEVIELQSQFLSARAEVLSELLNGKTHNK